MKKIILFTAALLGSQLIKAQTNPTPVSIPYPAAYSQNFNALDGTGVVGSTLVYPAGFQGGRVAAAAPSNVGRLTAATLDYALRAGGSAATITAGVWDYTGKIGLHSDAGADASVLLALNTSTVPVTEQVNVSFDASVMRNQYDATITGSDIVIGLAFMYRVGTTDNFTLVDNAFINNQNAAQSTSGTTPVRTVNASFNLPLACSGQPVVQIRWIMRLISGTATNGSFRPNYAIDNIVARGVSTLPVSLGSFSGKAENRGIKLNWNTFSEKNSDKFEILRAGSNKVFYKIGELKAQGNSDKTTNYTYSDNAPINGNNYYQLRQIDFDGTATDFSTISVKNSFNSEGVSIFYNQTDSQLQINFDASQGNISNFKIIDLQGKKVLDQSLFETQNVGSVAIPFIAVQGIYVGVLTIGNQVISKKFAVK